MVAGFIYYFTKSGLCHHLNIENYDLALKHDTARLTLDYELDLTLIREIFTALYKSQYLFSLNEVVKFLNKHPILTNSNLAIQSEYWKRTSEKAKLLYEDSDGLLREI